MGFMDNLKDKAEEFGDKAKEGFGAAKDKASDLVDDVKDKFDGDDETPGDQPTSQDKVEDAVDYSPESLDEASRGPPRRSMTRQRPPRPPRPRPPTHWTRWTRRSSRWIPASAPALRRIRWTAGSTAARRDRLIRPRGRSD